MYTVNQLAKRCQTAPHVVRYYAQIGLLEADKQLQNGYRQFAGDQVSRLRFIRLAKQLGFTLNEIKQITAHADRNESPCRDVRAIIQGRIEENRRKIDEMQLLQQRMETALAKWQTMPDGEPDGHSVCHLIESFEPVEDKQ